MVITTLAIGLACDFSAHLTHAYLRARHDTVSRDKATKQALQVMASPILKGACSTLVAVLPMALSQ